ncbi:MAG: nitroreductase family protein [Deferribacterales bacterium]
MDILTGIKERRSINFFEVGKVIPDDTEIELIKVANLAPSSMNLQPWKLIVVKTEEMKEKLMQVAFGQPKVKEASVVFVIIADPKALEENIDKVLESWVNLGYIDKPTAEKYKQMAFALYSDPNSEKRKIFAVKNSSFFAMNLMNAARGFGLETHPMDGFDEASLKKLFNLDDNVIIPLIIACGYKREGITLLPRAFRRDIDDFVKFV